MKACLLYLSALPLGVGGIETHLLGLFEAVAEEYELILFAPARADFVRRAEAKGCLVRAWQVKNIFDFSAWRALYRFLRETKPAIVHIHDARAAFIFRFLKIFFDAPLIYTVHLPPYYYPFEGLGATLRAAFYAFWEKMLNRYCTDKIIYVGQHLYEEAIALGYARRSQAVLVENGIDLSPFRRSHPTLRKLLRESMGVKDQTSLFICVARQAIEKSIDVLLYATARLKEDNADFCLWLVGDGDQRVSLETLSRELSLGDHVRFLGSRTDIPDLLAASDAFVLLSSYEGRTLSVMEAQAAGLPCVLSDVGDHPFMLVEGKTGYIVPRGDASAAAHAMRLLLDRENRLKMSAQAHQHAFSHFDQKEQNEKTISLYRLFR